MVPLAEDCFDKSELWDLVFMRLSTHTIKGDPLTELKLIDVPALILIHIVHELSSLVFREDDADDVSEAVHDLFAVKGATFVCIKLTEEPLRVFAEPRQPCGDLEHGEAELEMITIGWALEKDVWLDGSYNTFLQLLIFLEGNLELINQFKDEAIAATI